MVFLVLVYWYVYRPLPQTSGVASAPVTARVRIERDAHGVPHITAGSVEDALFAQGYAMAQDRLWQMDGARRVAFGTLSEVAGSAALESDLETRRLRVWRVAEDAAQRMPQNERAALAAFARGVNHYIETNRGKLPIEFTLMGYDPQPWRVADSIGIYLQMYRTLTGSWKREVQKAAMLGGGDPKKVAELFPVRDGSEVQPGSNAWVVSGKLTASGKPLLANDPHLEFSLPSVWHMAHLKAPGFEVSGVALVGVPCIIIGHNLKIAWGVTNLGFDVEDLYLEKLDPATGQYVFQGRVEQARLERDVVHVKGGKSVGLDVWVTRHGPVILLNKGVSLALRWTAAENGGVNFPFLDVDRAQNWDEFLAACGRFPGPAQNLLYADREGNIGYHVVGRLPIRKKHMGDVPVDGTSGEYEWDGYIPFEELPSAYNPASGMIISANQNPFPADYKYAVSGNFAPPYRAAQIHNLLTSGKKLRPTEMLAIQGDLYSAFSHFLAKQVVAVYDKRGVNNAALGPAAELLRSWNGQMLKTTPEPMIISLVFQHLRTAIADKATPGKGLNYEYAMAPAVLERLLRQRPAGWFDDWDQLLLRSFVDAMEEGKRIQGRDPKMWDYGVYNQLYLVHPVTGRIKWFGQYFNIGPEPMSGSSTSVKQTTRRLGPSMRMVADLSNWDDSVQNIATGESGNLLSWRYKDQWKAYYNVSSLPMQFERVAVKDTLTLQPK